MSFTGVSSLDRSIDKTNVWLADIAEGFGTEDRRVAYRALRAWCHAVRDRVGVTTAAHFAAQLPELLRGVFYDGWSPGRVPMKYDRAEFVARFAGDARMRLADVNTAASVVTAVVRRHTSAGTVDEVFAQLPRPIRELMEPRAAVPARGDGS
ncbi:MAG TPA: DUF2267 domain-containing protein [Streptosporangiaceae bacterium]|nr:DUF2267 domain-containing protein [Streptosporangiaceae bacterium]